MTKLLFSTLLLLPLTGLAQQDNSTKNSVTFNLTQPGEVNYVDSSGSKVTITVVPDIDGAVKVDALKSCQALVNGLGAPVTAIVGKFPVTTTVNQWYQTLVAPLGLLQPQIVTLKIKLDALYPPIVPPP